METPIPRQHEGELVAWDALNISQIDSRCLELAATHIALYSQIEVFRVDLITSILGSDYKRAYPLLNHVRGNAAWDSMFKAAITQHFSKRRADIVLRMCKFLLGPTKKLRDRLAHEIWGFCNRYPEHLVLVDPQKLGSHKQLVREQMHLLIAARCAGEDLTPFLNFPTTVDVTLKDCSLFSRDNLRRALGRAQHGCQMLAVLASDMKRSHDEPGEQYAQLTVDMLRAQLATIYPEFDPSPTDVQDET